MRNCVAFAMRFAYLKRRRRANDRALKGDVKLKGDVEVG
jgi:hypothetical protein